MNQFGALMGIYVIYWCITCVCLGFPIRWTEGVSGWAQVREGACWLELAEKS